MDFNEHFLRLGTNDNFVFNWAVFPPLAHWQILQEGLVDLIWLRLREQRLEIVWPVLLPALALFALATINLLITYRSQKEIRNEKKEKFTPYASERSLPLGRLTPHASRFILHPSSFILLLFSLVLTYLMLRGTAEIAQADEQTQSDLPLLTTLTHSARSGDALLVPIPPFGDVQEVTTRLMAYQNRSLPTYAWIESDPRAIQPVEREHIWQAVHQEAQRVWLFERWLTQGDPPTPTAIRLNEEAFPLQEQWFEGSGRLTLYALAGQDSPTPTPLNIPFQGGLTLLDFAMLGDAPAPGEVLKLRLTWQAATAADLAGQNLPPASLIAFAQLVDEAGGQKAAQVDRLLVDLQNFQGSPLLPGQTLRQGYGLQLPADLPRGAYSLVVGIYQAGSGQRLPRADGSPDDFLYLTTLQIK
ncbi:MAG: hypothetical protein DPW09_30650 [Anaerolineae bacterium]|nr:hypothetical protein [Anaerolineae bacterium]